MIYVELFLIVAIIVYITYAKKKIIPSYNKKIARIRSKQKMLEEGRKEYLEDYKKMNNLVKECVAMRMLHPELKGMYWRKDSYDK